MRPFILYIRSQLKSFFVKVSPGYLISEILLSILGGLSEVNMLEWVYSKTIASIAAVLSKDNTSVICFLSDILGCAKACSRKELLALNSEINHMIKYDKIGLFLQNWIP